MNQVARSPKRRRQQDLSEGLRALIQRLESDAMDRVGKRRSLEERWIVDLQQYHGQYDEQTQKNLEENEASQLFVNQTQPKTDAYSAKLGDLLFPTDDKNWGIKPTPDPQLTQEASQAAEAGERLRLMAQESREAAAAEQADADDQRLAQAQDLEEQAEVAEDASRQRQGVIDEAKARCDRMSEKLDDQLKEARYAAVMRDVIDDACKLGTGVVKGPVTGRQVRKGWKKTQVKNKNGGFTELYELGKSRGEDPTFLKVDLWGFFPDMDARTIEECEGIFERHLKNNKELRKLARLPGFDKEAIRRLLEKGPSDSAPQYLHDVRSITGNNEVISKQYFQVWEYSGPIAGEEMLLMAEAFNQKDTLKDLEDIDLLEEIQAVIWFCNGEVLKFSIYPMDSGEPIYSVFNLMKDEATLFGKGVPYMARHLQSALNAGFRAMMDNAGLASGSQIIVNTQAIEPEDGSYRLTPRKVWKAIAGIPKDSRNFETFDIPMHQAEMANIIELSKRMLDDVTSMPQINQGEPGNGVAQTVGGAVLIMNSNNVVFRRVVKNFDDDLTVPNIRRLYDWNMQFNKDETIKGDYEVDARGSSVLLVRELQAQNLFLIALHLGAHPVYGPMLKQRNVLKLLFQAHMIPADEILLSEDEINETVDAAMVTAQAQQKLAEVEERKIDLEESKVDAQNAGANMKAANDIKIANVKYQQALHLKMVDQETAMMKMAGEMNMNIDKLEAMLEGKAADHLAKKEMLAAELEATAIIGKPSGGGFV